MAAMAFTLTPRGPFTLASAARFIDGWAPANRPANGASDGAPVVRLGFLCGDWTGDAGVTLRQAADGTVHGEMESGTATDPERVRAQAARVVSLDHDGAGYAELGRRDRVVGRLQQASGFLRPVLFHSPYEAAGWAVISSRLRQAQAGAVRAALAEAHGGAVDVAGERMLTFPPPERLRAVTESEGLPEEKLRRLHGIADAALTGALDRETLLAQSQEEAVGALRELRGIGPFWADGIWLRAVGPTDGLTVIEERVRTKTAALYGRPEIADDPDAFTALAEAWHPYRTWVTVLIRAAG